MNKPVIRVNDTVHMMPEPRIKLWRIIAQHKEEMRLLGQKLLEELEKMNAIKHQRGAVDAYNGLLDKISSLSDELQDKQTEGKIKIIESAFEIESIEDLPVSAIPVLFDQIDAYLTALISGKADQLPNAETPPAE